MKLIVTKVQVEIYQVPTGTFSNELKIADIVPVFKKEDQNDKTTFASNFKNI